MHVQHPQQTRGMRRRDLLKTSLTAGLTLSAWPLAHPAALWGAEAGQPKRGGILRVRGWDPRGGAARGKLGGRRRFHCYAWAA